MYVVMIEITKRCHWEGFLESVNKRTVWTAHRYVSGDPTDGGRAQVPTLKVQQHGQATHEAVSNQDKS